MAHTTTEPANLRPYYVPADLDFDSLPETVQRAVDEFVTPAYRELVLEASGALERAAGASFVCLLFLELLEQFDLGRQVAQEAERLAPREVELKRHLRLLVSKQQAGNFLLRIRNLRPQPEAGTSPAQAFDQGD
jgi:hypothetical protein